MGKAFRDILRGTTLYYAQFNFFLLIIFVGASVWSVKSFVVTPKASVPEAAVLPQSEVAGGVPIPQSDYNVEISKTGQVKVNGKKTRSVIDFQADKDKFLLVLVRNSTSYLPLVTAKVTVPKALNTIEDLQPRVYAIHGVGAHSVQLVNRETILFRANDVYDGATVSIELSFPKGYFSLSPFDRLRERSAAFSPQMWLVLGTIFPLFTLLFLIFIIVKQRIAVKKLATTAVRAKPPAPLPPAIVGALYRGRIGRKEITSTLFDLALRGYLLLDYSGNELAFGKGESMFDAKATQLRPFEIFLLHQLFGEEGFISRESKVEVGLNSELFSSKVALAMLNIYDATLAEGFFIQSPNKYYLKYKITGWILFFVGLAALLFQALTSPARDYTLFMWLGMIAASLLIATITPGLPRRTPLGDKSLAEWLAFRNYLSSRAPLDHTSSTLFFTYLPYAIVMNCENEWIARWHNSPIALPRWFSASKDLYTAEDYGSSIISVVNYMATHLVAARPPDLA